MVPGGISHLGRASAQDGAGEVAGRRLLRRAHAPAARVRQVARQRPPRAAPVRVGVVPLDQHLPARARALCVWVCVYV